MNNKYAYIFLFLILFTLVIFLPIDRLLGSLLYGSLSKVLNSLSIIIGLILLIGIFYKISNRKPVEVNKSKKR